MSAFYALAPKMPAAAGHWSVGARTFAVTNDQPRGH
jgi:hypothetical protein